jgi:acetyl esterase/lipase
MDTEKLVMIGESAGGHLALMTGMLDPAAGFDNACAWSQGQDPVRVAAIINYFAAPMFLTCLMGQIAERGPLNGAAAWPIALG